MTKVKRVKDLDLGLRYVGYYSIKDDSFLQFWAFNNDADAEEFIKEHKNEEDSKHIYVHVDGDIKVIVED